MKILSNVSARTKASLFLWEEATISHHVGHFSFYIKCLKNKRFFYFHVEKFINQKFIARRFYRIPIAEKNPLEYLKKHFDLVYAE